MRAAVLQNLVLEYLQILGGDFTPPPTAASTV